MIVKQPDEKFATAPEGTFLATCVDEIDLGKVKTEYGGEERERAMVRLVWQLDEVAEKTGKPFFIKQDYTASLHEKSALRKHLQTWRGRTFTPEELMGFDLESIIGACCLISVVHATGRKGGTFANVGGVMKLPKGSAPTHQLDYVRVKDRKAPEPDPLVSKPRGYQAPAEEQPPDFGYNGGITDDDVPF